MLKFESDKAEIVEILTTMARHASASETEEALQLVDIPTIKHPNSAGEKLGLRACLLADAIADASSDYISRKEPKK